MITGLGAAAIHLLVSQYQIFELSNKFPQFLEIEKEGSQYEFKTYKKK